MGDLFEWISDFHFLFNWNWNIWHFLLSCPDMTSTHLIQVYVAFLPLQISCNLLEESPSHHAGCRSCVSFLEVWTNVILSLLIASWFSVVCVSDFFSPFILVIAVVLSSTILQGLWWRETSVSFSECMCLKLHEQLCWRVSFWLNCWSMQWAPPAKL